jgi:ubiquitin
MSLIDRMMAQVSQTLKEELYMSVIKTLAVSTLAAGLLVGANCAYAQSVAGTRQPPSKKDNMSFDIPKPMKVEHDELHSNLARLTKAGGRTGEAAKSVAKVLDPHFTNENAYALPPLGLLVPLSQGKFECNMTEVLKMTDKLEAEMPTMLSEHKDIEAALKKLKDAATAETKPAGVQFAEHLAAHAQTEEEITYPTALLIGLYVKSKAPQCAR